MIFYWVLISLAYVNTLTSAVSLLEYFEQVDMANELIELACHTIIPNRIQNGFGIAIKTIVRGNQYSFEEMNYMLAIPDYANYARLEDYIGYQTRMQTEIINATNLLRVPPRGGNDIISIGQIRRRKTAETIKSLFYFDLLHGYDRNYTIDDKCVLIGLAIQSSYALSYTDSVKTVRNICEIMDTHGNIRKYKEIGNQFWEVHIMDPDIITGNLIEQLNIMSTL